MMDPRYGVANTIRHSTTPMGNRNPFSESTPFQRGLYFAKGQRRRMNVVAILIALFLPSAIFSFVYGVLSFWIHYHQAYLAYTLVALAAGVCFLAVFFAMRALENKVFEATYQPSWYFFIAITSVLALFLAAATGETNFIQYVQPYYNYENLASYQDIDTNAYLGQQLMDAGRIEFKQGTSLNVGRSMGFKSHDIYCVAPIMTKGSADSALSVDFWAVGKNCCSGVAADFHCSGFNDPHATGVIRMMQDADRPFYRLAVQQAEATYHMTATHPLFFQWVHSSEEAVNEFWQKGFRNYLLWTCSFFMLQAFLTAATTLAFSKLIHT